jgi:hypothetical protein
VCEKCEELDERIAHYRQLLKSISDKQLTSALIHSIAEMEQKKSDLHPNQPH